MGEEGLGYVELSLTRDPQEIDELSLQYCPIHILRRCKGLLSHGCATLHEVVVSECCCVSNHSLNPPVGAPMFAATAELDQP